MKTCLWVFADHGEFWDTSCENAFCFEADGPKENKFKFCPYCGGKLKTSKDLL